MIREGRYETIRMRAAMAILGALLLSAPAAVAQMGGGGMGGGGMGGGGMGGGGMGSGTLTTFETADFSGSGTCAFCHSALTDTTGADVSIDAHWRATMMANAGKDPLWQAKISAEVARNPALQPIIEEKCSRCHMGAARYQALTDGLPVAVLGAGFLDPDHPLHAAAMDGVTCTLCHQITDTGLGTEASFTGQYDIDTSTEPPTRVAYGPYAQGIVRQPMEMHAGFTPEPGAHVRDSALCGACHVLYTPSVDPDGAVLGEFPEQTTYLEWEHGLAGGGAATSCQGCHLPEAAGAAAISNRPWWLSPRSPFGQHHLVGGNAFMVGLIGDNAAALGATADPEHFAATLARTEAQLGDQSASLRVASGAVASGVLRVELGVGNLAGHKLPSGIPARRAWLHVVVRDKRGALVFESGRPLADGRIAGNDADLDPELYEPHHDLIATPDDVQIYEPVMLDSDGRVTYTLLRAFAYAKDNRLLPVGFDKAGAPPDIAVWGGAAEDPSFADGRDLVTYQADVSGRRSPFTVAATLYYQAVSYPFAEDLRTTSTPLVARFFGMYDAADKAPRALATAAATVR